MNTILDIISSINNMYQLSNNNNTHNLSTMFVNNDVNKKNDTLSYIKNLCEYVDKKATNTTNVNAMYNYDKISENISSISKIYQNMKNTNVENIHRQNISNLANLEGFYTSFVDKSENSVDKEDLFVEKHNLFHNNSDFKEIYNYVDNLSKSDNITNNSSLSRSNVNINMGGITQNISEANCNAVLDELSEILVRALSGCDGVY